MTTTFKSLAFSPTGLTVPYTAPVDTEVIIFSINFVPDLTTINSAISLNNKLKIDIKNSPDSLNGNVKCKFVLNSGETLTVDVDGTTSGTINLVEINTSIISNIIVGGTPTGNKTETFAQNFREKYLLYSPYAVVSNATFEALFNEFKDILKTAGTGVEVGSSTLLSQFTSPAYGYVVASLNSYTNLNQIFATYGISPLFIPETSQSYPLFVINRDAPFYAKLERWSGYSVEFYPLWPTLYQAARTNNHVFTSIESLLSSNTVNNGQVAYITDVSLFLEQINTSYLTSNIRRYNLTGKTGRLTLTSNDLYTDYESLFV